MARTRKENLNYFPFDTDFFFDTKIRRLKSKYGTEGIMVYQYILCSIYRTKGYYLIYDEDFVFELSEYFNIDENSVIEMINFMKSRSLLVIVEVDSMTVLTSVGVQRRYQEAKKEISRKSKKSYQVDGRIWLLNDEETIDKITISFLENSSGNNADYSVANAANKSKVNKSKVNESKVNESKVNESKVNESKENEIKLNESKVDESKADEKEPEYTGLYQTEPDYTELHEDNVNDLTQTSDLTSPNNKTHLLIPYFFIFLPYKHTKT